MMMYMTATTNPKFDDKNGSVIQGLSSRVPLTRHHQSSRIVPSFILRYRVASKRTNAGKVVFVIQSST